LSKEFFKSFVEENMGIIMHICKVYAKDPDDLQDLIQEVTFQLWKSHQNFEGKSQVSTWVYRVTLNVCLYFARKSKRNFETVPLLDVDQFEDFNETEKEQIELLYHSIKKLNESDRAIALLYLDDKSYQEMSDVLGITVSNVGVKVNRMKEKLKKMIYA
jgi:RNA polymerase sigma-70 factor (ECF subfamily)